jgi:hypothetical protein
MKLSFSSSDITEIGRVGRKFIEAGIACGVRYDPPTQGVSPAPAHGELWVQNETDFYRAVVLYLRQGSGGLTEATNCDRTQEVSAPLPSRSEGH